MFFLIDYENVGSGGLQGAEFLECGDTVIFFYSESCEAAQFRYMRPMREKVGDLRSVRIIKQRRNAADLYIAVCLGRLTERGAEGGIAIISKDRGFVSAKEYTEEYGEGRTEVCISPTIEDAILRLDAASWRGQRIAELRRRVPIGEV